MLNRTSLIAALPICDRLSERGLNVLPSDNTPLMGMVETIDRSFTEMEVDKDIVQLVQERSSTDENRLCKAQIIAIGSKAVSILHDTVKHKVLPEIKDLIAAVEPEVTRRRVESILPYVVKMVEIPAVYSNPVISAYIDRYPKVSSEYALRDIVGVCSVEDVKALCRTGMAGADAELDVVLGQSGDDGYLKIREVLIGRLHPTELHRDYLPGLLVGAQALYDEPRPGVNMSLNEYNTQVNKLLGAAAFLARGVSIRYGDLKKMGTLYAPFPSDSLSTIMVMGSAYRRMLDEGLTPEALIGNEMTSRRFKQGELIEQRAALEQVYAREMNLRTVRAQAQMAGVVREELTRHMKIAVAARDVSDDERLRMSQTVDTYARMISAGNCENLYTLAKEVVCLTFYPDADALAFINLIDKTGEALPEDTDPREITLMATARYLAAWVGRQMGLVAA